MLYNETALAYGVFWAAYCVAFLVFFYVTKRALRFVPVYGIRSLLLATLVVALLTPVESPSVAGWWMPAWLFTGYEWVLGNADHAARGAFNYSVAALVMLLIWLLDLVRYRITRKQ